MPYLFFSLIATTSLNSTHPKTRSPHPKSKISINSGRKQITCTLCTQLNQKPLNVGKLIITSLLTTWLRLFVEKKCNAQTGKRRMGEWPRWQIVSSFYGEDVIWDQLFSIESKPREKETQLVNFEKMGTTWKSWAIKTQKDFTSQFVLARNLSYVSSSLTFSLHQSQTIRGFSCRVHEPNFDCQ